MKVALQDAATVVLLRDGAQGLEVLMGKRSRRTRFSAGAYVFPGGAVDAMDSQALRHCGGQNLAELERLFGEPKALRFYLAAARELFEEAGIWLFSPQRPANWELLQHALHQGEISLDHVLAELPDAFDHSSLQYFRFWTTPPGMPRRYRTRFFAARAPGEQQVRVDGKELTEHCWTRPAEMLQRHANGEVDLIFPTIKELEALQDFDEVDAVLQVLSAQNEVTEIRTRHQFENGKFIRVLMPGEPGYEELPGW